MPNMTGNFIARAVAQNRFALDDMPDHELTLSQFIAEPSVSDENWEGVHMTFWGSRDLVQGFGPVRGYFVNQHPNGDRDCGSYDGHISVTDGARTMEGSWRYTHGSGKFASISGNGRFQGRMVSQTEVEMNWQGSYQLAAGTRVA